MTPPLDRASTVPGRARELGGDAIVATGGIEPGVTAAPLILQRARSLPRAACPHCTRQPRTATRNARLHPDRARVTLPAMTDTTIPRFFWSFPMQLVREARLDAMLADDGGIRILFLWGKDCPNCDVAKHEMLRAPARLQWDDVEWLHDNVYEDPTMGTRFGLHGIPAFLVFRGARKLGRIGQWPGTQAFVAAIEKIRAAA